MRLRSLLLRGLLLLVAAPLAAAPPAAPDLVIEAAPRFAGEAARLRWLPPSELAPVPELIGLADPGPPITVALVPESSPTARGAPPWVAGFAVPDRDLVVLFPERVPRYPDETLLILLRHEVTHVLAARAARDRPVPRWFSEGIALVASRGFAMPERSRLLLGGVSGLPASSAELEAAFRGEAYDPATAYALAGALVHHLVGAAGPEAPARILAAVGQGASFEAAFAAVAGEPLETFELAFWRRWRVWYRWVPFLTSGAALWIGVTALALLAIARRRARDAAIRRRWDEEERRDDELRLRLALLEAERRHLEGDEEVVH